LSSSTVSSISSISSSVSLAPIASQLPSFAHGLLGLFAFIFIAWLFSENKKAVRVKPILIGVLIQIILAIALSKISFFTDIFNWINKAVICLEHATMQGTSFVFGYVGGAKTPFKVQDNTSTYSLAFQALPLVIVISAISSLLFYYRIMPFIIRHISWVVSHVLGLGGAIAIGVSANLFLGMAESPLVIRPYMKRITHSELFTMMTCGMAGVAGTVMGLYVAILSPIMPHVMSHVIASVLISLPAVVFISRIMVPETNVLTEGRELYVENRLSAIDALTKGVSIGAQVFISIVAMLIVLVAIVSFIDKGLSLIPAIDGQVLSLSYLIGFLFQPIMWLVGIPWDQAHLAGNLMATRLVLNELVSYQQLAVLKAGALDAKSQLILVYAMCGFANISGLGIMLSTYNVLMPKRRKEFMALGGKALLAGTICTLMTGTIMGVLYPWL